MRDVKTTRPLVRPPDLSDEDDEDLIVYMAMFGEDLDESDGALVQEAFAELYRRHREYLYGVLYHRHRKELELLYGPGGVADHVNETFIKALKGAGTYQCGKPGRNRSRLIRAWLGKIAYNDLVDKLRARQEELAWTKMDLEELESSLKILKREQVPNSKEYRLIYKALDELNEKEEYVLRMTFMYQQPGQEGRPMPREKVAEIAHTLNTTHENIRQIRSRALKKIRRYVDAHQ